MKLVQCPHELDPGRHRNLVYFGTATLEEIFDLLLDFVLCYLEMRFPDIGNQGIDRFVEVCNLIPFELPDRLDATENMAAYRLGIIFPGIKELNGQFIGGVTEPIDYLPPLQVISLLSIARRSSVIITDALRLLFPWKHEKRHALLVKRTLIASAPGFETVHHA